MKSSSPKEEATNVERVKPEATLTAKESNLTRSGRLPQSISSSVGPLALWSGAQAPTDADFAEGGVLRGSFPHRQNQGSCVVWVNSSTLWIHVAQALGFSVSALYTKDTIFGNVMEKEFPELHIGAPPESVDWSTSVITEVDLVFTDFQVVQSLPKAYWETTHQIHLATMRREDSWEPPED